MTDLQRVIQADRKLIDERLRRELRFGGEVPTKLAAAMRYAVLGLGKRIRPVLMLEAFRAAGGRGLAAVLPFCAGIEFIHTFSLIHDDLPSMDDDDYRRGRPSLHRKFNEATAILAADGLFALAFEVFAGAPGPADRRLAAIHIVSRAVGPSGMTGGQMLDMNDAGGRGRNARSQASRVLLTHRKKTAEFIAAAVLAGAVLGGAEPAARRKLARAGLALGMLFQMTDDLLDAAQESEAERATMVTSLGRARTAHRAAAEAVRSEKLFRSAGTAYEVLAGFPGWVLNRRS
jgi:geranylgeranyl pyrophosphate synthase